jgi:hypothetical protein
MAEPDVKFPILLVYMYSVETDKGKKAARFVKISSEAWEEVKEGDPVKLDPAGAHAGQVVVFAGKFIKNFYPGTVVRVVATDEEGSSVYGDTAAYEGRWPDDELVEEWRTQDKLQRTLWEKKTKLLKDKGDDPWPKVTLEELRQQYRKQVGSFRRAAILANVIEYITRGGG